MKYDKNPYALSMPERAIRAGGLVLGLAGLVWLGAPAMDSNPMTQGVVPLMDVAADASESVSRGLDHLPAPLDSVADLPRIPEPDPVTPFNGSNQIQRELGGMPLDPADL